MDKVKPAQCLEKVWQGGWVRCSRRAVPGGNTCLQHSPDAIAARQERSEVPAMMADAELAEIQSRHAQTPSALTRKRFALTPHCESCCECATWGEVLKTGCYPCDAAKLLAEVRRLRAAGKVISEGGIE